MSKKQTLAGRRIGITRAREQASELAEKLAALGAEPVELPLIKISREISKQNLADTMLELGNYDWMVFTSVNGVRYFFAQFFELFEDIRALGLIRFAVVGDATAQAIENLHLRVECQPKTGNGEALAKALIETGSLDSAKVLVITGNLNRDDLTKILEEEGRAIVDQLQVYKTEQNELTDDASAADFRKHGADAVLFGSSSAVQSYVSQGDALALSAGAKVPLFGSIGTLTSETIVESGLALAFEAKKPSLDSLVTALVKKLGS